ncbi:hypothetical protein L195_g037920, partial [Trifolium pratense]
GELRWSSSSKWKRSAMRDRSVILIESMWEHLREVADLFILEKARNPFTGMMTLAVEIERCDVQWETRYLREKPVGVTIIESRV